MLDVADILGSLKNTNVFFHFENDIIDWTQDIPVNLIIQANNTKSVIELKDSKEIEKIAASLYYFAQDSNLISWNLKNIISFFKKKSKINIKFNKIVYDLKILCSYFGISQKKPEKLRESVFILNYIKNTKGWETFDNFYKEVYYPLLSEVVPDIENNCLVNAFEKKLVYSYYEIDGQSNGRMKNVKVLKDSYMPHSMGDAEKENLRTLSDLDTFVYFDYKHMEVSVLEWISKDKKLSQILKSNKDLYKSIWKILTGQEASKEQRKICKNIFLPIVFGQGSYSLSKTIGVDEKIASKLIYKLGQTFPVAFTWVNSQVADSNNYATDIFGRRRKFDIDELYKIKNFSIQSPSNMICLKKLVKLHNELKDKAKVCFHIHDGYCVYCNKKKLKEVLEIGKKTLEQDDELFPDLKLKVSCHYGERLNNLKNKGD